MMEAERQRWAVCISLWFVYTEEGFDWKFLQISSTFLFHFIVVWFEFFAKHWFWRQSWILWKVDKLNLCILDRSKALICGNKFSSEVCLPKYIVKYVLVYQGGFCQQHWSQKHFNSLLSSLVCISKWIWWGELKIRTNIYGSS